MELCNIFSWSDRVWFESVIRSHVGISLNIWKHNVYWRCKLQANSFSEIFIPGWTTMQISSCAVETGKLLLRVFTGSSNTIYFWYSAEQMLFVSFPMSGNNFFRLIFQSTFLIWKKQYYRLVISLDDLYMPPAWVFKVELRIYEIENLLVIPPSFGN